MEPPHQLSHEKCVFEELSSVNSSSSPFLMLFLCCARRDGGGESQPNSLHTFLKFQNSGDQPVVTKACRLTHVIQLCNLSLWRKLQELACVTLMQAQPFDILPRNNTHI